MLITYLQQKIKFQQENYLYRCRKIIKAVQANVITVDGQHCLNFCSNDYLGLTHDHRIKQATMDAIDQYGIGSGASPLISGFSPPQAQLEQEFAAFLDVEKALYFNSGFMANLAVLASLITRHDTVIADKFIHASLLDGIRLAKCHLYRFRHNDMAHLNALLHRTITNSYIVTEGVFSMSGNIAPLPDILTAAQKYNATLILDDAHGMGVLGANGKGSAEYFGISHQNIPCTIIPLAKTFASMGAIVAGRADLIEFILQFGRSYRYSSALPPALAVATLTALKIIQAEPWRREKLVNLIINFTQQAESKNLPLITTSLTPIKSFLVGDNQQVITLQKQLIEQGFYVAAIRSPTVPDGKAQIRISLNYNHSHSDINRLLNCIAINLKHASHSN